MRRRIRRIQKHQAVFTQERHIQRPTQAFKEKRYMKNEKKQEGKTQEHAKGHAAPEKRDRRRDMSLLPHTQRQESSAPAQGKKANTKLKRDHTSTNTQETKI